MLDVSADERVKFGFDVNDTKSALRVSLTSSVISFQMKLKMALLSSLIMLEGKIIQQPTYQSLEQIDVLTSIALAHSVRFRPRYRFMFFSLYLEWPSHFPVLNFRPYKHHTS